MRHQSFISYVLPLILLQTVVSCKQVTLKNQLPVTKNSHSAFTRSNNDEDFAADTLLYEGFEQHMKSNIKSGNISFQTGVWYLKDAKVATGDPYSAPGNHAIRIENNGKLSMRFDITSPVKLLFYVTCFVSGHDKHSDWGLFLSGDKGIIYKCLFVVRDTNRFERKVFILEKQPKSLMRFEIRKLSGGTNKINFDDVLIGYIKE